MERYSIDAAVLKHFSNSAAGSVTAGAAKPPACCTACGRRTHVAGVTIRQQDEKLFCNVLSALAHGSIGIKELPDASTFFSLCLLLVPILGPASWLHVR